jgi:hypothetical protein
MNYELRIMSFKNSYRVQSYDFFCKYANFGVSLRHIWAENKKYGNYTHVDTVTKNNKNYLLKKQLKQLARQSTLCRAQGISCKCHQVFDTFFYVIVWKCGSEKKRDHRVITTKWSRERLL